MSRTLSDLTNFLRERNYNAVLRIGKHAEDLGKPFSCWLFPLEFGKEIRCTSEISIDHAIDLAMSELHLQQGID